MSQIMKISGVSLLSFCFVIIGFLYAERLKKRVKEIQIITECLRKLKNEIFYTGKELECVLPIAFSNAQFVDTGGEYPVIIGSVLNREEKDLFNDFIRNLGTDSRDTECEKCEMYIEKFTDFLKSAEGEYKEKARIFKAFGISLAGLAFVFFM